MDRRWRIKIEGQKEQVLKYNPVHYMVRPTKTVEYKPTIDNKIVRVTPARFPVENYIELGWQSVDHEFRNLFYDLFVNDTKFTIKSHLWDANKSELREIWTVKIDEFDPQYKFSGSRQKWDLQLVLRVLEGVNDPIIKHEFDSVPFSFLIDNRTNRVIHEGAFVFLRPIPHPVMRFPDGVGAKIYTAPADGTIPPPSSPVWVEFTEEEYDRVSGGYFLLPFMFTDE